MVCPERDDKPFVFRNVIVYSFRLKRVLVYAASVERSLSLKEKKKFSLSLLLFLYLNALFSSPSPYLPLSFSQPSARCEISGKRVVCKELSAKCVSSFFLSCVMKRERAFKIFFFAED